MGHCQLFTNFEIMASKSKVYFFSHNVKGEISKRTLLRQTLEFLFKKEKKELDCLNYVFCSDEFLLKLNREYLQHDYYTDIITFTLSGDEAPINAEAYISIDRVRDNARRFALPFNRELLRVVIHGALHLCGYSDKSARKKVQMRKKEDHYLAYLD